MEEILAQQILLLLKFVNLHLLVPAQILFLVSAYRCFFPVNYTTHAVMHDSIFSSVFITRFLATFVEIAYIYQFSYLIRFINENQIPMIDILSWLKFEIDPFLLRISVIEFSICEFMSLKCSPPHGQVRKHITCMAKNNYLISNFSSILLTPFKKNCSK